ncbi:nucleotide exchange factor Sil1 isoform X2 [Drosophila guanche]|uniref:Nucleotide exchange factor SIL1 n=1 Tax=Drosophila guanche TaxID=7266 RepID=A0A3B0JNK6_DROGU|nr:nucleotide exchange factor Sil1 isoform X2 [Drosophila guanche]SPP83807.1 blast:Nucleotide exchange factor SIL1 [Drosophila guanche]
MNGKQLVLVLATVLALGSLQVAATETSDNKTGEFVATRDWQVISEGQAIPKGLHVRINLQTGLKEAKLLDESERGTALQSQTEESDSEPMALDYKKDVAEAAQRHAKEYVELRKAYKEFQKNFRTDGELIVQLIGQYRNFSKKPLESELKTKLDALENLEFLLHQIDNALVFIDNGGLDDVLLPIVVNDTNTALRVSAMRVLGSLTSNNPKAQIKVFEKSFGSYLSQILMSSTSSAEISSALHAFGALLRKFPLAQTRVLSTSGTQALIRVLRSPDMELRSKGKVVTLISDLVLEKRSVLEGSKDTTDAASSFAQYVLIEFESWLETQGYCTALDDVLAKDFLHLLDQPELVEQFSTAIWTTQSMCHVVWSQSSALRHALLTIRNRYANSKDEYRLEVSQALDNICKRLYDKPKHTELAHNKRKPHHKFH